MKISEQAKLKGVFTLKAFNREGECIMNYEDNNLVVTVARTSLARLLAQADTQASKRITKIGFGTSGTTPALPDTGLTGAIVKAVGGFSYPDAISVSFEWSLEFNEANGLNIREFGLISDDDTLFARKTRDVIVKTSSIRLEGTWTIIF